MSVPLRLGLFVALLLAVFGGAALAGGAIDPDGADPDAGHSAPAAVEGAAHGADAPDAAHGDEATDPHAEDATATTALPGLAAAQDGLRLDLATTAAPRPGATRIAFRILDADGAPVRTFDVAHDKRMHLVVVRRDLGVFRHVHPDLAADGTWSIDVDLPAAGTYRVFADFTIDGTQRTLGTDLQVAGDFSPRSLPAAATTADAGDGLEVRLRRDGDRLAFDVLRDGRDVAPELEDHLGAKGHLVTLRAADLAYLHTHPDGDALAFEASLPTAGAYRAWVEFRLDGVVRTAAFTLEEDR